MQLFFATALFLSAALLFAMEPMFAKMVLPLLGGSPSVWNTCLVFYQAALLAGYVYAHLAVTWLGVRRQAAVHLVLLCLPWLVLPIARQTASQMTTSHPATWLLLVMTLSVGLPFFCVSATAPLLQAWFAATGHRSAKDPYFLYAASNLGSMLGLAAYPLLIEPRMTLAAQSWWWAAGYGLLMAMIAGCATWLWRSRGPAPQPDEPPAAGREALDEAPLTLGRRLRWLALSIVPSSLLLGVTAHISTDIGSMPFLWVVPLMLYLLSFVLVFSRWKLLRGRGWAWAQAASLVVLGGAFFLGGVSTSQIIVLAGIHLLAFFLTAMVCHGQLAADRPASRHLTEFYLWMSLGGVVGGLLTALVAPLVFKTVMEYPLMLVAACLLRPRLGSSRKWLEIADVVLMVSLLAVLGVAVWGIQGKFTGLAALGGPGKFIAGGLGKFIAGFNGRLLLLVLAGLAAFALQRRPARFAVAVGALLLVDLACADREAPLYRARSFFGVLRVEKGEDYDEDDQFYTYHSLMHGTTLHGIQSWDPEEPGVPISYYHRDGPIGDIFQVLESRPNFRTQGRIGVVGLGTGTMAAYGQPGQHITFFEIDPTVEQIAWNPNYFTYLLDCPATVEVCLGDARLSLAREPDKSFDVLVIDAFSSDAIPLHLLTREALELYFSKLADHGLLAVHISNRHLNLEPVLGNLAREMHVASQVRDYPGVNLRGAKRFGASWVVLARREQDLEGLPEHDYEDGSWEPAATDSQPPWTDDFSNIAGVVNWHLKWGWLKDWWDSLWPQEEKPAAE
jgi:hypothetical protein